MKWPANGQTLRLELANTANAAAALFLDFSRARNLFRFVQGSGWFFPRRTNTCLHYNRTQVASPTGGLVVTTARRPYGAVKLYQDKTEIPGSNDVIALLSVSGEAGDEARFITAFLYRAADIGADGVIFTRLGQTGVAFPGPFFTTINSVSAAYRGIGANLMISFPMDSARVENDELDGVL